MTDTRYRDDYGNIEKVDAGNNHFINGKCVNPKGWEETPIGGTFSPEGLTESLIQDEVEVTGHVAEFSYYDHDNKQTVYVDTRD